MNQVHGVSDSLDIDTRVDKSLTVISGAFSMLLVTVTTVVGYRFLNTDSGMMEAVLGALFFLLSVWTLTTSWLFVKVLQEIPDSALRSISASRRLNTVMMSMEVDKQLSSQALKDDDER